ncbi:MAG: CapA family protein, partial [Pseudomonadota bacterium]
LHSVALSSIGRALRTGDQVLNRGTRHITLVLAGDTGYAPHRAAPRPKSVSKHGRTLSFAETTRFIRSEINGDINFANMETVISGRRSLQARPKAFNFVTHPNGARHLVNAGFNLFSMANNHSFDYGAEGVRESVRHADALQKDGLLAHAGVGLNRSQAAAAPVFSMKGSRFTFGSIGIGASSGGIQRATATRPGQLNLRNPRDLGLLMSNLRTADADYRILSVHQGPERMIRPSAYEVAGVRNTMLKQGDIDLYIGHHAHVARGVELNGDRLVIYGLGNFLHHGTANMAGKGGCRDYSLLMRVHLVAKDGEKPKLAALEALPITATHVQTKRMTPLRAAQRIAILNGLAKQFDSKNGTSSGVRFDIQNDGRGLFCTPAAAGNAATRSLCASHRPFDGSRAKRYARALATCGRSYRHRRSDGDSAPLLLTKKATTPPKVRTSKRAKPFRSANLRGTAKRTVQKRRRTQVAILSRKRPNLSRMTKAQRKTYWTKVWYAKQARKRARRRN